jgi:hypothetical protein
LLVIIITTFLALLAVAAGALYLGFTPRTALEFGEAQQRMSQLEARNVQLEAHNAAIQTQIVQLMSQAGSDRETLDALEIEVQSFSELRQSLATQIAVDGRERATLMTEMADGREAIQAFATAEAGRAGVLDELGRRSERIERFLQRLSDIAGDAALDVGGGTTLPEETSTATAAPGPTTTPAATTVNAEATIAPATETPTPTARP